MSWKDNPVAVAGATAAGTITLVAMLVFTAVIPTWLRSKDNEISNLQREPTRLKSELDALTGQLRMVESENLKLRRDLDRLSQDTVFSLDDVYPRGFRAIRIGDRLDLLRKVYTTDAEFLEDEGPWTSVRFTKPQLFSQITYYYDQDAKVRTVTHILFHFGTQDERTFNFLKQQLIDKYSESNMRETKTWKHNKQFQWSGIHKHTVTLGDGTLSIDREE